MPVIFDTVLSELHMSQILLVENQQLLESPMHNIDEPASDDTTSLGFTNKSDEN